MNKSPKKVTLRIILQALLFIVLLPFLPLLIAARWDWWQAWAYGALAVLSFIFSRALAAKVHPDLIAERAKFGRQEDAQPWDRKFLGLLAVLSLALALVAGLDERLGGSAAFPAWAHYAALALVAAGYAFSSWALVVNRYFSGTVRLQRERGQVVCAEGPYRVMRHPGYAGGLLTYLALPFLLDSLWLLIPALLIVALTVMRTAREDAFLQQNLEGYGEYAGRVRFRLLPGIW